MPKDTSSISYHANTQCAICGTVANRPVDLARHMKVHAQDKSDISYYCCYEGCTFTALQKSNLDTHIRTHTKEKHLNCPDCDYATGDPSCLLRHRKRRHGYIPRQYRGKGKAAKASKAPVKAPAPDSTTLSSALEVLYESSTSLPSFPSTEPNWFPLNSDPCMVASSQAIMYTPSPRQAYPALHVPQLENTDALFGYPAFYPMPSSSNGTAMNLDNSSSLGAWPSFLENGDGGACHYLSGSPSVSTASGSSAASVGVLPSSTVPEIDMNSWFNGMTMPAYGQVPSSELVPAQAPVADSWADFLASFDSANSGSSIFPGL